MWGRLLLLLCGVVLAWPVLAGGYATYVDNPVHLAEIDALAVDGGWTDVAACGLPLSLLHSPVAYGLLALLARAGVASGPPYALALLLGFVGPALAVHEVARRRVEPWAALGLAWLVLVQQPNLYGIGSPLAGMWTAGLAAGAWVLLAERLDRPARTGRDVAALAGLLGVIALLHPFVLVAAAVLGLVHATRAAVSRETRGRLLPDAGAALLGAAIGAVYWIPAVATRHAMNDWQERLAIGDLLRRMVLPIDLLRLPTGSGLRTDLFLADAVPMLLLLALGIAGARRARLAGLAAGALLLVTLSQAPLLGPQPWRYLEYVRLALAMAAIPVLARLPELPARARAGMAGGVLALSLLFSLPLAREARVDPADLAPVRDLWTWLREASLPGGGRVALQDTFGAKPADSLARSHLLALTARETGIRHTVGAWYGVLPYATTWTVSEYGNLLGGAVRAPEDVPTLAARMRLVNAGVLVLADPAKGPLLAGSGLFRPRAAFGRFGVWELVRGGGGWAEPIEAGPAVRADAPGPGRYAVEVVRPARILVKTTFHPYWRGTGSLEPDPRTGCLVLDRLPPGATRIDLAWRAPRWPWLVSLAGAVAAAVLALRSR